MKLFLAVLLSLLQGLARSLLVDSRRDRGHCPVGRFPCGNVSVCLPQLLQCNGAKDCKNGADEENCGNNVGWPMLFAEMFNSNRKRSRNKEKAANCTLVQHPAECSCAGTAVHCGGRDLSFVPQISSNLTELNLKRNQIPSLRDNQFITYAKLEKLFLQDNNIQSISSSALAGLFSLRWLYLSSNRITQLGPRVFRDLHLLEWLLLDHNNITEVIPSAFVGLKSLLFLDLRNNALSALPKIPICAEMPKLNWLDLEGNLLHTVQRSNFQGCSQLTVLVLSRNRIEWIQEGTFNELNRLVELDLSFNWLKELLPSTLKGLQELQQLNISSNPLRMIFPDEFDNVPQLRSLSMESLEIPNIHSRMFEKLRNLSHIYLKKFHYCSFAPHVRLCKPPTDGISSFRHLLASPILRVCVWLVTFLTCFGNLFVICLRSFTVPESSTHTMAIKSLCLADCLTGIYLFLLGIFDLKFSGEYNQHAQAWMASLSCQLVGGLALLSSEVSVLLLTYMTLEKYLCIVFPFSCYGAGKRRTLCTLIAIWLLGFGLALVPFLFFKNYYGTNGVCFPLQSNGAESPAARGYSAGIFLGLNLVAFICIVCAYTHMFYSIHTTAARTAECNVFSMDVTIAKRFFFIVSTNALCWIPIFVLKFLSLLSVDIPGTATSWVVVFILPINSALNPILYTITTPLPGEAQGLSAEEQALPPSRRPREQALPSYPHTPATSDSGRGVSPLEDDG